MLRFVQSPPRRWLRQVSVLLLVALILLSAGCSPAEWVARRRVTGAVERIAASLTPADGESVLAHVSELSSAAYAGRQAGSAGGRKAAEYIAAQFKAMGLTPLTGDSYFQEFSIPYVHPATAPVVKVDDGAGRETTLTYGVDVAYSIFSDSAALTQAPLALLTAWPAPADAQLRGKAVMLVPNQSFANLTYKAVYAALKERGATCVIIPSVPADQITDLWATEDIVAGIASIGVSERGADALLAASGRSYAGWRQEYSGSDAQSKPAVVDVAGSLTLRWQIDAAPRTARNVLGYLPGKAGPEGPTLLLTAHYDHLGAIPDGPYWPGAWDNASGSATMLAVAESLRDTQPELNVIVAAWDAEEQGLVGSAEFARRLPVPIERLAAVLNFDCVGTKDAISIERTPSGPLTARLLAAAAAFNLKTETSEVKPWSDAASFTALRAAEEAVECVQIFDAGDPYQVPFLHATDDTIANLNATNLGHLVDTATTAILALKATDVDR